LLRRGCAVAKDALANTVVINKPSATANTAPDNFEPPV